MEKPLLSVRIRRLIALLVGWLLSACASLPTPSPPVQRSGAEAQACAAWFSALDDLVDAAGVRDAGGHRIAGHPYLRADRFVASLRTEAARSDAAFGTWVARLQALDRSARRAELLALPPERLQPLAATPSDAWQRLVHCAQVLAHEDLATPAGRERLSSRVVVPDDYVPWVRHSGLYALASGPFSLGVAGWERDARAMFQRAAAGQPPPQRMRVVEPAGDDVSAAQVRAAFSRATHDALGVPLLAPADEALLLRAYAPRYEIETLGAYDRFGALAWAAGPSPQVDATQPVVYWRLAHTRLGGRVLVQLVYTLWFPERPLAHAFDLLGGTLDGLVLRVTLDEDGTPLLWDSIHPCGCYHMFFPTAAMQALPSPDPQGREEWAFIPARLPAMAPAQRIGVKIASATHDLVAVAPAPTRAAGAETYTLVDEDGLRMLALPGGGRRSIYGPDALVPGTERAERLFFWPMGIVSAGAMRQWGRHPTAFVGRRHFDDADLIERRFARSQQGR